MLKGKELNNVLGEIMMGIDAAKPYYIGGEEELFKNIEMGQFNGYVWIKFVVNTWNTHDDANKHLYEYKLLEKDGAEEIIRGLIDNVYKKDLLPRKQEIKTFKKQLKQKMDQIFKWEINLNNVIFTIPLDLEKKNKCLNKLSKINEDIYDRMMRMKVLREKKYEYETLKNILYAVLKNYSKEKVS
ncbi:hypothetical protein [Clostridium tyrobutyricum]|uniref:hypothetical protein n=1 Tax=Clostridium tyrobutyricum TaxID=1519 RepID=UPI002B1FB902|nr:hypothetical protein [Clostridium tyrobutyricum]MEA5008757.1 hypothetical protein [Clostridium tyrobutyricum]